MRRGAALVAALAIVGCDQGDAPRRPTERPPITPSAAPALDLDAGAPPATSASAAPATSGAATTGEAGSFAGAWEGKYEAKKATVGMPPKVKDKPRAADEGKAAVGAGTIALTVGPSGEVRGKVKGALGDGLLTGKVDGAWLRATLLPEDPTSGHAMTGVLVAKLVDGKLEGEVRAAGPDAVLVREAAISLAKK